MLFEGPLPTGCPSWETSGVVRGQGRAWNPQQNMNLGTSLLSVSS
jgi:hypothetical protein